MYLWKMFLCQEILLILVKQAAEHHYTVKPVYESHPRDQTSGYYEQVAFLIRFINP